MLWTSQNPDGFMSIRIQESNWGHTNQQLPATKRALADPTRAALLCKQGQGLATSEERLHTLGEEPGISHPSAVEAEEKRKTTTGCCFLMLFVS